MKGIQVIASDEYYNIDNFMKKCEEFVDGINCICECMEKALKESQGTESKTMEQLFNENAYFERIYNKGILKLKDLECAIENLPYELRIGEKKKQMTQADELFLI